MPYFGDKKRSLTGGPHQAGAGGRTGRRARELRRAMTVEEQALWYRYLQKHPLHWYRQRVIGKYIVDFYCRAAALVVELDGQQHEELDQHYADQVRDRKLEAEGLRVLRFRNQEVRYHLGRVCSAIEDAVTCP